MKNYIKTCAILGIASLTVQSAQAVLIHGWDFSNLDFFGPGADWSVTPANFGILGDGLLWTTEFEQLENVNGSNIDTFQVTSNDGTTVGTAGTEFSTETMDPAAISIFNAGVNDKGIVLEFSTLGFQSIELQYALRVEMYGANNNFWQYSLNGIDYTPIAGATDSGMPIGEYVLRYHNFSTLTAIDNQATVYLRYQLGGSTGTGANPDSVMAIDNLQINAVAVPEPTTTAFLLALAIVTMTFVRRRRLDS